MPFLAMLPMLLEVITAFFKFPEAVTNLVKIFKDLPVESQDKIIKSIQEEQDKFKQTGRPTWG